MRALSHLDRLEAESIHIMRETVAEAARPVMLYSIGKDSAVMLHLAKKAFYPAPLPFPLLHVDTSWKFRDMYRLRDKVAQQDGVELLVYKNPEAEARGINPFDHGSLHTDLWKTEGLKQALDKYGFDAAFGGARRDEEKSRAKERIFSFRSASHRWDPKRQRPELWSLYNVRKASGESMRIFPLSNWTELDVWRYIGEEDLEMPSIYFAHEREVFERDGMLLATSEWLQPDQEEVFSASVRYRTVGDMTITGAVESSAATVEDVIAETAATRLTERGQTRADDRTSEAAMEDRKREGYF
jgi:sulfate adenylyltransferase subunit 2